MKIEEFVPPIIGEFHSDVPWHEWIRGSVLFADVSGFTPMSEALSPLGAEGAEILTDILNRYFEAMIKIIHTHGGQVMKFGGDAILCFFPGKRTLHRTLYCAKLMQDGMGRFTRIRTSIKSFTLKMKIGIAEGEVLLGGVGDPAVRCDYLFAGEPVDLTSDAEHHAKAGEIILAHPNGVPDIQGLRGEEVAEGFTKILDISDPNWKQASTEAPSDVNDEMLRSYLIPEVYAMVSKGYARHVGALLGIVPLFMQFTGFTYTRETFNLSKFHDFFTTVMAITNRYSGRLNRISMGDKGSTFFILFGAPNPLEKREEMACQWALELRQVLHPRFPGIGFTIGMNTGRVFAGIVGGSGRMEYTVMGDAVNFAARLMQGAKGKQICLSREVKNAAAERFGFTFSGKRRFKGKAEPLEVYRLEDRRRRGRIPCQAATFVGRRGEVKQIEDLLEGALQGDPAMAVLEGEPGVGKSCLAAQILNRASQRRLKIVTGKGEITLKNHAYAVWAEILTALFFPDRTPVLKEIEEMLRETDDTLIPYLPWFADLLGIPAPSDPPEHDEETKKALFHHQVATIILQKASQEGLFVFLDDLHWFDTLSLELLADLLNHIKGHPIFILATARPGWERESFANRSTCYFISLGELTMEKTRDLIQATLNGRARDYLVAFIYDHSRGNPFFSIRLVEHLRETGSLETRLGQWTVKRGVEMEKGLSLGDVITTQVARLPIAERIHLRMMACMGPTFYMRILKRSMGGKFRKRAVEGLVRAGYIQPVDEEKTSFLHALVQETIYTAIPQKIRRSTHRRIGKTMEKVFSHRLDEVYPNLANHFHLGDLPQKARLYEYLAGKKLYEHYSYPEALSFLERALQRMHSGMPHFWETGELTIEACLRSGELSKAQARAKKLKQRALRRKEKQRAYLFTLLFFQAKIKLGDFSFVSQAKRLSYRDFPPSLKNPFYLSFGKAYYFLGKYREALSFLEPLLQEAPETEREEALIYASCIYLHQGNQDAAIHLLKKTYQNKVLGGQAYKALHLGSALAGIYMTTRKRKEGEALLLQLAKQAESLGDYYHLAGILFNLGHLYYNINKEKEAEIFSHEALDLFSRIGALNSVAQVHLLLGAVYFKERKYKLSYDAYKKGSEIYQKTDEKIMLISIWYNLAEVCFVLKNYQEAKQWLHLGLKHLEKVQHQELQQAYHTLAQKIQRTTGR